MKIDKREFQAAVEACMPATIETEHINLTVDSVYAEAPLISISTPLELSEDINFAVRAGDLHNVLKRFVADEVDLVIKEDKLIIKGGKAKATLALSAIKEGHPWPCILPDSYVALPSNFMEGLQSCYIPNNNAKMSGVYIHDSVAHSTDRVKINYFVLDSDMPTMWLPDSSVKILLGLGNFDRFIVRSGVASFSNLDGQVVNCKLLNADCYPVSVFAHYSKLLLDDTSVAFELPATLADVIKRAAPLAEKTKDGSFISLTFVPEGVILATDKSTGGYEELCEFDCGQELPPILLDYRHLLYGISKGTTAKVVEVEHKDAVFSLLVLSNAYSQHILVTATQEG